MGWTFHSAETLPEPGDIVWCKWPLRERLGQPGPWVRPVLVLESDTREDTATETKFGTLLVCYGTDYHKRGSGLTFSIDTMARARAVGLHKPTSFSLEGTNVKRLLWCEEFFVPPDYVRGRGLIVGRLNNEERQTVRDLLATVR